MTEAEWLAAIHPTPLLEFLKDKATDRKLRLFAAACCRRNWDILDPELSQPGVEMIERFADAMASAGELEELHRAANQAGRSFERRRAWRLNRNQVSTVEDDQIYLDSQQAFLIAYASKEEDYMDMVLIFSTQCHVRKGIDHKPHVDKEAHDEWYRLIAVDYAQLANVLRDLFENPFRAAAVDPEWRTSAVASIAKTMYDSRDFAPMSILADALEDAGCENEDILNHCRSGGPHLRDCWVVDLILGKE